MNFGLFTNRNINTSVQIIQSLRTDIEQSTINNELHERYTARERKKKYNTNTQQKRAQTNFTAQIGAYKLILPTHKYIIHIPISLEDYMYTRVVHKVT